ncbi:MAG TPA: class IV adenylate cyclase [Candidatus Binataceae bacterium]|nr:class IV adenylate cyclase [Candidatus Binataceae bacterium]
MRNLEAKFRLDNLAIARSRAETIGYSYRATLIQRDTFFTVPHGKLKLREEPETATLIHYRRDHDVTLELSNYSIVPVSNPAELRTMLEAALGTIAEVRKRRTLLMRENIRLHLDEVENLGCFGEIEAVIPEDENAERHRPAVEEILATLAITPAERISVSYFEMMRDAARHLS